jgi:glycosyltransferase involved in cell wall biosynthesis
VEPSLLWLASYFLHPSGHADEARAFLRALEAHGCAPAAAQLKGRRVRRTDDPRLNVKLAPHDRAMLERQLERRPRAPCVAVHHYVPRPGREPLSGMVNVARAMFETDRLPSGWAELLESWDEVWVPSRHNLDVFIEGGVPSSKLRLIGQTIDFDAFHPDVEAYPLRVPDGHFVFLANFDFSERKGWRQLLHAWTRAFHSRDPVCLVLKTGSVGRFDERFVRELILDFMRVELPRGDRHPAPVKVMSRMLPAADVPHLYAAADAYVSASRGEAWGRPYMEAMATGLPTVGTRYGGNLDFMSDDNSWLVDGEIVPVGEDSELPNDLYRGHRWFEADVDELAAVLREIASDPVGAKLKAATAREELIVRFGTHAIARRVMESARAAVACHDMRAPGGLYAARAYAGSAATSSRSAPTVLAAGTGPSARPAR